MKLIYQSYSGGNYEKLQDCLDENNRFLKEDALGIIFWAERVIWQIKELGKEFFKLDQENLIKKEEERIKLVRSNVRSVKEFELKSQNKKCNSKILNSFMKEFDENFMIYKKNELEKMIHTYKNAITPYPSLAEQYLIYVDQLKKSLNETCN